MGREFLFYVDLTTPKENKLLFSVGVVGSIMEEPSAPGGGNMSFYGVKHPGYEEHDPYNSDRKPLGKDQALEIIRSSTVQSGDRLRSCLNAAKTAGLSDATIEAYEELVRKIDLMKRSIDQQVDGGLFVKQEKKEGVQGN